ncbi:MAG: hypothetical protein LUG95_07065 [Clostridiales bacterium]|nr:hypothetical protein [Clostridiales bacterium]
MHFFEVKAKKVSTNRLNKRKISAKNEEEAIEIAKTMDLIASFEVSAASFEPPTESQIEYAKSLKMKIPNDARARDVSAMLS